MRRALRLLRVPCMLMGLRSLKYYCQEKHEGVDRVMQQFQQLDQLNRELITYTTMVKPLEGQLIAFTIKNGVRDHKIVLTRYKGKVYAISAYCTYDLEADLSEGICFNNKLYCPKHGCQYDITNGWVENAPAIDNLPIFSVEETEEQLIIYAPSQVPKKVIPEYMGRDYNDMRKVVIYGGGAAAFGCMSTLRENSYGGELTVITDDIDIPYDKTQLTKRIKNTIPEDFYLRSHQWYENTGIQMLHKRQVTFINNKHNDTFVELEDGNRIGYDAAMICTGTTQCHKNIQGIDRQPYYYLDSLQHHQNLKQRLNTTQNLTVIGINQKSLEAVSTIRREYPHIKISLVDVNAENWYQSKYGQDITDAILNLHIDNGVTIYDRANIKEITDNQIIFHDDYKIVSDTLLLMPNLSTPNTEFLETSSAAFEFGVDGRVKADFNQRTDTKRIFAAGSCAATYYHINGTVHPGTQWTAAFHQGVTAAYNILALNIPWHQIPITYTEQYGRILQQTSNWKHFDQVYIQGDLESWDFVAYYALDDFIVGAVGTPSRKNAIPIINEAIRVSALPMLTELKSGSQNIETIKERIKLKNKSGCYKSIVYEQRLDAVDEFLLWQLRDNFSQRYLPWEDTTIGVAEPAKGTTD